MSLPITKTIPIGDEWRSSSAPDSVHGPVGSEGVCALCGITFIRRSGNQKYHSYSCQQRASDRRRTARAIERAPPAFRTQTCRRCGYAFLSSRRKNGKWPGSCARCTTAARKYPASNVVPCMWCSRLFQPMSSEKLCALCKEARAHQQLYAHKPWMTAEVECHECGGFFVKPSSHARLCSECEPWQRYMHTLRKRNKERGHGPMGLTVTDVRRIYSEPCQYCGGIRGGVPSADRIDGAVGYELSNVVPACLRCNQERGTLTYREWLVVCAMRGYKGPALVGRRIYSLLEGIG